jgi:small-conductance mechanosensitive channel
MLDLERYGLEESWPKLRKLQEEVASLEKRRGEAEAAVYAARNAIPSAQEQDTEAAAKAIRAGKSMPATKHEAKARAALEDAERNLTAYHKAVASAQSDLARFTAAHAEELRDAMLDALDDKARELARVAREAAVLYGQLEDAKYDLKQFAPPPAPPDENAPAQKLSTSVISVGTQRSVGPARGDVEQMLGYLASLAPSEAKRPVERRVA